MQLHIIFLAALVCKECSTTFLLSLARMLEAFYRAIKAVNQSLLNDPWFLTCFTGSDTVVAANRTHFFSLSGLQTQSKGLSAMWKRLQGKEIALLVPGCELHASLLMLVCRGRRGRRKTARGEWGGADEEQSEPSFVGVVFQFPMYSCRDVFANACTPHKFGSTGYI